MKKVSIVLASFLLLAACGEETVKEEPVKEEPVKEEAPVEEEATEETTEETPAEETAVEGIDTSVFESAEAVEVTDAIEINNYVTVFVDMNEKLDQGMAAQEVVNQTYDFIQQEDLEGANKVSINMRQGGTKLFMFEVDREAFEPKDDEPMANVVMEYSTIDMMSPAIEEYGKVMGAW